VSGERNLDARTVDGFGDEWSRFDYVEHSPAELEQLFQQYFSIFPWERLSPESVGFDLGCGSGRWARLVAPRVGKLHCVDASADALAVARRNLADARNCAFELASVDALPFADGSMDFGYSLGVLHHIPDTREGIRACVRKLKPGAPFLLYLYYALDHRPAAFRAIWRASNLVREGVSRLPHPARYAVSQAIAGAVYWPLARAARVLETLGANVDNMPLATYRDRSFYVMRTDALDRFGTRLEKRFSRAQVRNMMIDSGLDDISFRDAMPFWCAVGIRR
jgi:SAM-dependent methyltransferase